MSHENTKISPEETYVLGDEELEELDDTSLTSIVRQINDPSSAEDGEDQSGIDQFGSKLFDNDYRDPEIDQLLQSNANSSGPDDSTDDGAGVFCDSEVLMPHGAAFSNDDSGNEA